MSLENVEKISYSRSISKLLLIYLLLEDNTSLDAPVTKLSNGMDFISRLSKEQQAQYGPLEDKTSRGAGNSSHQVRIDLN